VVRRGFAQLPGHFKTVDSRHFDIGNYQLELPLGYLLKRVFAGNGNFHIITVCDENPTLHRPRGDRIINDKNGWAFAAFFRREYFCCGGAIHALEDIRHIEDESRAAVSHNSCAGHIADSFEAVAEALADDVLQRYHLLDHADLHRHG